jgi:nitrogen regulatory protein PII
MENMSMLSNFELLCVIVNYGVGSKVLKYAKEEGIKGGTIILGKGTYKRPILEFLELTETRKEMVLMIASRKIINPALEALNERLKLYKPHHGIAFVIPVTQFLGAGKYEYDAKNEIGGHNVTEYNAIFTIVDKGFGEKVVDAATLAGAKGATIINARGSGIHETSKLFSMEIEPEKEIVLILAEKTIVKPIIDSICEELDIEQPGNGVIFVQEVHQTYGIR